MPCVSRRIWPLRTFSTRLGVWRKLRTLLARHLPMRAQTRWYRSKSHSSRRTRTTMLTQLQQQTLCSLAHWSRSSSTRQPTSQQPITRLHLSMEAATVLYKAVLKTSEVKIWSAGSRTDWWIVVQQTKAEAGDVNYQSHELLQSWKLIMTGRARIRLWPRMVDLRSSLLLSQTAMRLINTGVGQAMGREVEPKQLASKLDIVRIQLASAASKPRLRWLSPASALDRPSLMSLSSSKVVSHLSANRFHPKILDKSRPSLIVQRCSKSSFRSKWHR